MTLSERKGGTEETGCRDQEEANKAPRVQTPRAPWPPATALCCLALVPYLAARSDTGWGGRGRASQRMAKSPKCCCPARLRIVCRVFYKALPLTSPGLVSLGGKQGRCPQGGDLAQFPIGLFTWNHPANGTKHFPRGCSPATEELSQFEALGR